MKTKSNEQQQLRKEKAVRKKFNKAAFVDNAQLFAMVLPTTVLLLMFAYAPMFGVVLAFKNYKITKGIWGSEWCGFDNFKFFFGSQDAVRVIRNTLCLNLLFISFSVICGVFFALMMFEITKKIHIKFYQTVAIIPSFLSWVVVGIVVYAILDPTRGVIGQLLETLNLEKISWYSEPKYWPGILLISQLWHNVGLNSIIYYAALMGVDNSLYEAAELDGANKWQKTKAVSIPQLVPIVTIMTILEIGKIFRSDFGLFYNVTKNAGALYPTTDVIDTYVFRTLMSIGNVGMSSAVGLVQSVVCLVTILVANWLVTKLEPDNALF